MASLSRLGVRPLSGATFDANFRARTILARGVSGGLDGITTPDELLTCARAGVARTMDLGAVAASVDANRLRFAHHPVSGAARGLAIERSGFNVLPQSQAIDTWTIVNATIAPNAASALNGTQTADVVTETSTSAPGNVYRTFTVPASAGAPFLYEAVVAPLSGATNFNFTIALSGGTPTNGAATFDLKNGQVIGYVGPVAAFIEPAPRGRFRIGILIFNTNNTLLTVGIGRAVAADPPAVYSVTDSAVDTQPRFPLVVNPTLNDQVLRNADDVRLAMSGQQWFNPGTGTFLLEFELFGDPGATTTILCLYVNDQEYLRVYRDGGSGSIVCAMVTAAGGSTLTIVGADALPGRYRLAYSYAPGDFRAAMYGGKAEAIDGGIVQSFLGSIAANLGAGTLCFGSLNGNNFMDGCIGRVAYRPSSTPAADISDLVR